MAVIVVAATVDFGCVAAGGGCGCRGSHPAITTTRMPVMTMARIMLSGLLFDVGNVMGYYIAA